MRCLAMETSGREATIAALVGEENGASLVKQIELPRSQRTAQALAPALSDLLEGLDWPATSIDLVAVAVGPGSFTGLRIGVTVAKTFAYATGAEVVGVNTLDVLAAQTPAQGATLWTVVDAQRSELFAARYTLGDDGRWETEAPTHLVPADAWFTQLGGGESITGPALAKYQVRLDRLGGELTIVDADHWNPLALTVGHLGYQRYVAGQRDDLWQLVPKYYRLSAAEEKRNRGRDPRAEPGA